MLLRATLPILVLCAFVGRVSAGESDPGAEAKHHFEEGTKLFNLGEFGAAAEQYKAAYKAKPDPVFLYNIAQALRLNNDLTNAVFFYRSYLRNSSDAPNRKEVERRIRELDAQIAQQKAVTTAPPNEPVPPSGANRPSSEPTTATHPTATPAAAAQEPSPEPTASVAKSPSAAGAERTPVYKKWWLWTIVGVGVVGVAAGVGVGVGTRSSAPSSHFGTVLSF